MLVDVSYVDCTPELTPDGDDFATASRVNQVSKRSSTDSDWTTAKGTGKKAEDYQSRQRRRQGASNVEDCEENVARPVYGQASIQLRKWPQKQRSGEVAQNPHRHDERGKKRIGGVVGGHDLANGWSEHGRSKWSESTVSGHREACELMGNSREKGIVADD
jgi:hypothetical protein